MSSRRRAERVSVQFTPPVCGQADRQSRCGSCIGYESGQTRKPDLVADKGYHSKRCLVDLALAGHRTYICEPLRGRQQWNGEELEQHAVYGNRRRKNGPRGRRLIRYRGERLERSFAHVLDTGGMRRTPLRGHENILKRMLVHVSAFNLGLLMRKMFGFGTPRGLQGRPAALHAAFSDAVAAIVTLIYVILGVAGPRDRCRDKLKGFRVPGLGLPATD